jgi:hypothetical protein
MTAARAPHRNYVKRKRYLNESIDLIKKTLECLASVRRENPNPAEISQQALSRALEIEATCWTTLPRPANEDYNRVMMAKTREVCVALITNAIGPAPAATYLQVLLTAMPIPLLPVPRPNWVRRRSRGNRPNYPVIATHSKRLDLIF